MSSNINLNISELVKLLKQKLIEENPKWDGDIMIISSNTDNMTAAFENSTICVSEQALWLEKDDYTIILTDAEGN